jgi:hypothetical protein
VALVVLGYEEDLAGSVWIRADDSYAGHRSLGGQWQALRVSRLDPCAGRELDDFGLALLVEARAKPNPAGREQEQQRNDPLRVLRREQKLPAIGIYEGNGIALRERTRNHGPRSRVVGGDEVGPGRIAGGELRILDAV